jgi:hypothetical protein
MYSSRARDLMRGFIKDRMMPGGGASERQHLFDRPTWHAEPGLRESSD